MRAFFCFSMESADSIQSNKSIRSIPSIKATIGFILLAALALGDTHSASCNVTVDTRTAAVTSLTITGPDSVIGGNSATYLCEATYADGSKADVSSLCTWSTVGTVPAGAQMYGPSLATAFSFSSQTVQIRAAYQRPEGQVPSPLFTVTITAEDVMQAKLRNPRAEGISPGNWEVSAEAKAFGIYGEVQCEWKLDGVVLSGVTGTQLTHYPISGGVPGTRLLAVHVTDEQNQTATASQLIAFNKPPIPRQPVFVYPVTDPVDGNMLDSFGDEFKFYSDCKSVGLVILTHGLISEGTTQWMQDLGHSIAGRLVIQEKPVPNICLYDWKERADPFGMEAYNLEANKNLLSFFGKWPADAAFFIYDTMAIHPFAVTQGKRLADWIRDEVAAGNIDPAAPMHLIGHSAGGFVMGECAFLLKYRGIIQGVVQVTALDTPYTYVFPGDTHVFNLAKVAGSNCRVERYFYSFWPGFAWQPGPVDTVNTGSGYYKRLVWTFKWTPWGAHAWVHDWYDEETVSSPGREQDGFYYSPFMNNGFHGVQFGQNAQAFALAADISMDSAIPDSLLTDFETFGAVTLTNGLYQVTEEANAGLFKEIALPIGAQSVKFNYRFATAGDGDFLVVYWGTNGMPLYVGSDLQLSRDAFMEGEAPVSMFAGETNKLTFMLVSRGETNAVLELKDIALTLSDDPDYDGLTTSEEATLETDPLNSDTDGDGLSDFDEVRTYFTDPLFTDSDEDGMSDLNEIQAGSDPNDPDSCFAVSLTPLPSGGVRLTWQGKTGRHYRVNRCDQLGAGSYTTLATGVSGVEPQTTYDDTQGGSRAFYWVEQEQN